MSKEFPNNQLIARVLGENFTLTFPEWKKRIHEPILPFYKELDALLLNRNQSIFKVSTYMRNRDDSKNRECLTKRRWPYQHPALPYRNDGVSAFVMLGNNKPNEHNMIFWGLSWWGSEKNSGEIYKLFLKVKKDYEIINEKNQFGASGTYLKIIAKKYIPKQVIMLNRDIAEEIAEDLYMLVSGLNQSLSA